jgi:hypothetical protein
MRGTGAIAGTDFSNFQSEITMILLFIVFCIMAIWVLYNSDNYFEGVKRHLFWVLTLMTGPIGLGIYLFIRRKVDY